MTAAMPDSVSPTPRNATETVAPGRARPAAERVATPGGNAMAVMEEPPGSTGGETSTTTITAAVVVEEALAPLRAVTVRE